MLKRRILFIPAGVLHSSVGHLNGCSFECHKCRKIYKHKRTLYTHLKFECGKPAQFKCYVCNKTLARKKTLKNHLGMVHGIVSNRQ